MDNEMIAESIQRNSSFNIIHRESMFKVDVFIPRPRPFLQSQLARVRKQTFSFETEVSARFASPEDVILNKILFYREGGSEKHLRDISGILKIQRDRIDRAYIAKWATELNVSDVWEAILRRVGLL